MRFVIINVLSLFFFLFSQIILPQSSKTSNEEILAQIKGEVYSMNYEGESKLQLTSTKGKVLAFTQFLNGGGIYYGVTNGKDLDIYSLKLTKKAKPEFISKLKDNRKASTVELFTSICSTEQVEMFIAQDKILAITCGCSGDNASFSSIYRLDIAKKFSRFYDNRDKMPEIKKTKFNPGLNSSGNKVKKKLFIEKRNLFLKVGKPENKRRISNFEEVNPKDNKDNSEAKAEVKKYEVSPNGKLVLFEVVAKLGEEGSHGETFCYNIGKKALNKISNSFLKELNKSWDRTNDVLFFIESDGTEKSLIYKLSPKTGKVVKVPNTKDVFAVEVRK